MKCPICDAPSVRRYRPFCSRRCADIDLAKWMNGAYSVPARPDANPDEDLEQALQETAWEAPAGKVKFH